MDSSIPTLTSQTSQLNLRANVAKGFLFVIVSVCLILSLDSCTNPPNYSDQPIVVVLAEPSPTAASSNQPSPTISFPGSSPTPSFTPPPINTGGSGGPTGKSNIHCSDGRQMIIYAPHPPSSGSPKGIPLLIALYGHGDDYQNFASICEFAQWTALATTSNEVLFIVPSPQNPLAPTFLHLINNQALDKQGTLNEIKGIKNCIQNQLANKYNLDLSSIHLMGFSEGAVVANVAALYDPDSFRTATMMAGGLSYQGNTFVDKKIPLLFAYGSQDSSFSGSIVNISNKYTQLGFTVEIKVAVGVGHTFSGVSNKIGVPFLWSWIKTH